MSLPTNFFMGKGGGSPSGNLPAFFTSLSPSQVLSIAGDTIIASVFWQAAGQHDNLFDVTGYSTSSTTSRLAENIIATSSTPTSYGYWDISKPINNSHALCIYGENLSGVQSFLFAIEFTSGTPNQWHEYIGIHPSTSGTVIETQDQAPIYPVSGNVYNSSGNLEFSFSNHYWRWSSGQYNERRTDAGGMLEEATTRRWQTGGPDGVTLSSLDDGGWYINQTMSDAFFYDGNSGTDGYTGTIKTRVDPDSLSSTNPSSYNLWGFLNNNSSDGSAKLYLGATADTGSVSDNYNKIYGVLVNLGN